MKMNRGEKNVLSFARIEGQKGNIVWYLLAAVGGIAVFYLIFFFLWGAIKGWFVHGS